VFDIKPTEYLFVPLKNGEFLRDSRCNPRVYRSASLALKNLIYLEYDVIQIFAIDDVVTKDDFENNCILSINKSI